MKLALIFPVNEIGNDPVAIRDWAQGAEDLGFDQLQFYDHVLGEKTSTTRVAYNATTPFHEPFVLFGYLAAVTRRVELVTGILILPQRQTALVAKQAAEVDVLSGGRLLLGVGVGNIAMEYEALGQDFHQRGRRFEEQIELLRLLWTNETVRFEGRYDRIIDAGINPLPIQRPIPIWLGGGQTEAVLRRIGRLADGWIPDRQPGEESTQMVQTIRAAAQKAGRNPDDMIMAPRFMQDGGPDEWRAYAQHWKALGAQYVGLGTMRRGFERPDEHLALARRFKDAVADI